MCETGAQNAWENECHHLSGQSAPVVWCEVNQAQSGCPSTSCPPRQRLRLLGLIGLWWTIHHSGLLVQLPVHSLGPGFSRLVNDAIHSAHIHSRPLSFLVLKPLLARQMDSHSTENCRLLMFGEYVRTHIHTYR